MYLSSDTKIIVKLSNGQVYQTCVGSICEFYEQEHLLLDRTDKPEDYFYSYAQENFFVILEWLKNQNVTRFVRNHASLRVDSFPTLVGAKFEIIIE